MKRTLKNPILFSGKGIVPELGLIFLKTLIIVMAIAEIVHQIT